MKPNSLPLLFQGLGLASAMALAVFAPQPGQASVLLPLTPTAFGEAERLSARWATVEEAQLLAFDPVDGRARVIAPSALSLVRALSYGLVPIASDAPTCTADNNGQQNEGVVA